VTRTQLRPLAAADLVERTAYYRGEGGDELGERFFNAAIDSLDAIGRMPRAGSPRLGELCGIPGLRFRRIGRFPCGWFYFVTDDHVDVVRLLAEAQDLPALLGDTEPE
jgi:toxin ParE1/3/4